MFTGIIQKIGIVKKMKGHALEGRTDLQGRQGDSVAVNGACLTVIAPLKHGVLCFDVSAETFRLTNLGELKTGMNVNLEKALRAGDLLGGHLVSGHVDARAKILELENLSEGYIRLRAALPAALRGMVALKGSIAVDGISLTVTAKGSGWFETVLVPHTLKNTNMARREKGMAVNLEADLIARYVRSNLEYAPR